MYGIGSFHEVLMELDRLGWPKLLDASLHIVRVMVAMGGKGCKNMYHMGAVWLHLYQTKAKNRELFSPHLRAIYIF
jgi:hypothetical protein